MGHTDLIWGIKQKHAMAELLLISSPLSAERPLDVVSVHGLGGLAPHHNLAQRIGYEQLLAPLAGVGVWGAVRCVVVGVCRESNAMARPEGGSVWRPASPAHAMTRLILAPPS